MSEVMESEKLNKIRKLSHFQKQPPVNLEFQDLSYSIPQWRKEPKVILQGISGQFRSGHLNALMGSSGSGKTTLLNVLSGYKTRNVSGTVLMNDQPVVLKDFYKYSRYIMQEDLLQPRLTIEEAMMYAADFKLNRKLSKKHKLGLVTEILEILRLINVKDSYCNHLSGGEKKRVSIALELINNPPVLFLDEPTSGLDDVSSAQCIRLLKALADGGRTIICAIHTPSARMFEKFDNVYVLSNGSCVYQGYGRNLISFLPNIGLPCPTHYNPADFIVEISSGEYGLECIEKSTKLIENGKNFDFCRDSDTKAESLELDGCQTQLTSHYHSSSILHQFQVLVRRSFLQTYRDLFAFTFRIVLLVLGGILVGLAFREVTQDSSKLVYHFAYPYFCCIMCMYLSLFPVLLWFPQEIKLLKREHFNKWYGLPAYYLATSAVSLPIQTIFTPIYIGLSYVISHQPMEVGRIVPYILICILMSFTSESLGLMISSVFDVVNGLFMGPALALPLMLIATFGAGDPYGSIPVVLQAAMHLDYLRYGIQFLANFLYGYGRPVLRCPEDTFFCLITHPKTLLWVMRMDGIVEWLNLVMIIMWFFIFRTTSFFILQYRLKTDKRFKISKMFNKLHEL